MILSIPPPPPPLNAGYSLHQVPSKLKESAPGNVNVYSDERARVGAEAAAAEVMDAIAAQHPHPLDMLCGCAA